MPSSASPAAEFSTPSIVPPVGVALVSRAALQNVAQPGVELRLSPQVELRLATFRSSFFAVLSLFALFRGPLPFCCILPPPLCCVFVAVHFLACRKPLCCTRFLHFACCRSRAAIFSAGLSLSAVPFSLSLSLSSLAPPMASGAPILTPPSVLTRTTRLSS